jgi:ADP-heptose:LPS heptosyltransferase
MANTVAVRLEGGLGDHILGMRVLPFIKRRYPEYKISVYSDCGGNTAQLQVAAMSPYVTDIIPVFQDRERVNVHNMGELNNIEKRYLTLMTNADIFIDAWNKLLFIDASKLLDVPFYKILAARTRLKVCEDAKNRAIEILPNSPRSRYIAINLGSFQASAWRNNLSTIHEFFRQLLEDPDLYILNIYSRKFDFPHWPESERARRRAYIVELSEISAEMCEWSNRILPIVDEDIPTVAALLGKCSYFIGVDNGIKHLAWTLGVPLTFFYPSAPSLFHILRVIPDIHRMRDFSKLHIDPVLTEVKKYCHIRR